MAPVLGYWNLRGRAQPIRLLLKYAKQDYEEKLYTLGDEPDYDRSDWLKEKFTLGLDFPNLPYYIDGNVKLTQSMAITRYLAAKHNLIATKEDEKNRMLLAEYQMSDFRGQLTGMVYNPNYEQMREEFLKNLPDNLKRWSEFLGKHKWLAGETLTYVDFWFYECLDVFRLFKPGCLDEFANLTDFMKRFESLPEIAAYMKSSSFIKWPIHGTMAKWGGK